MTTVCVIGGGITGLTAAFYLRRAGFEATVIDANPAPGGVIRTTMRDGFLAEHGPNSILLTSPAVMELLADLGLAGNVIRPGPQARKRFIAKAGRPVALPSSPLGFLTSPLFSFGAKLRLLREPFMAAAPAGEDEDLASFVTRRLGKEFLDYAINPFVAGVYAGDPAMLSVRYAFPKLHALEQKYGSLIKGQIFGRKERRNRAAGQPGAAGRTTAAGAVNDAGMISLDTGLQTLTDTLAKGSTLRRGTVSELSREGEKWRVDGEPFDRVLYCGSAHALSRLRIATAPGATGLFEALGQFSEVRHPPVTQLALGFRREDVGHPLDGFGVLIPAVEPFELLGVLFPSSLFPGRAPEGSVLLSCFLGGMRNPALAPLDEARQIEICLKDLGRLLGVRGKPVFVNRAYYPEAIPQYGVGYDRFLDALDRLERDHPGLTFAGNFRNGISLANSIAAGREAAGRIAIEKGS